MLTDSRQGVNLTVQEAKDMAAIIGPLLRQGQSPYQIVTDHPELGISERTLYNYIKGGALQAVKMGKYWRVPESTLQAFISNGTMGKVPEK